MPNELSYLKEMIGHAGTIERILDYAEGEENGQLRRDCKYRVHDLSVVMLGSREEFTGDSSKNQRIKRVNNIYIGEPQKNESYTIIGDLYVDMIREVMRDEKPVARVLPAYTHGHYKLFEGTLDRILAILYEKWTSIYEFYITSIELDWLFHYEHHHHMYALGNAVARRMYYLSERRKWAASVLKRSFCQKDAPSSDISPWIFLHWLLLIFLSFIHN